MEIYLTHKVDFNRKIYRGEVREETEQQTKSLSTLILATNSEEALEKLKELVSQENPSYDPKMCTYRVTIEFIVS